MCELVTTNLADQVRDTSNSESAMRVMKSYLIAYIISGAASVDSSMWPEKGKMWFSQTMQTVWTDMAARLRATGGKSSHVEDVPTPTEA